MGGGPGGIGIVSPVSEEDDYFQGDFAAFSRPNQNFKPITQTGDVKCGTIAVSSRRYVVGYFLKSYQFAITRNC